MGLQALEKEPVMIRIALAIFLVLHGIAHGVGFASSWRLGEFRDSPLETTLLAGRLDVGVFGIRVMGILWLVTGAAFVLAAAGVWRDAAWWLPVTASVAVLSLAMSILGLPEARIGVVIDVLLLASLLFMGRVS